MSGRLELRDSAISGNRGESALELVSDDGMTVRDSEISDNAAAGIVDRGGGGLRAAHTEVSRNEGTGILGDGAGGVAVYHGRGLGQLAAGDPGAR